MQKLRKPGRSLVARVQPCHVGEALNACRRGGEVPSLDMAASLGRSGLRSHAFPRSIGMGRAGRSGAEARTDRLGDGPGGGDGAGGPASSDWCLHHQHQQHRLLQDQFSVEILLWTEWAGDAQSDPSDNLMILNGIYDGDIQRFERVSHEKTATGSWNLYRVRSAVVKRWRLQRYPFDDQILHIQIGLADPLQTVNLNVVDQEAVMVSPGLLLPGWTLKSAGAYASSVSLMSDLGRPLAAGEVIRRQPAVSLDVPIQRHSLLYVAADFLGYMLAVGLCIMSLLITHSRDDLILAAVVSAGGNFVFIAGKLPVTAMAGFIGNLQLIVFLGILYVVAADELIDVHLLKVNNRLSTVLRVLLLPSYVAMTLIGVYWIIP